MNDQEHRMLAYAHLAAISHERGQSTGLLRFLILAGIAACRAGFPDVAERCRSQVLAANPQHLLSQFESLTQALRSDDFRPFLNHLDRFCTFERAEHLLDQMNVDWKEVGELQLEQTALELLEKIESTETSN